jgi:copper chaperone CopZ
MQQQYEFMVEDVMCEKCVERIRHTLEDLPGAQEVELERLPQDEARVVLKASDTIPPAMIEQKVEQASIGTVQAIGSQRHYQVRWEVH